MRVRTIVSLLPVAALASVAAAIGDELPFGVAPPERPRLALALSGGGARGIAHIGALRALEEARIPVDAIAANSMGAVIGGLYASGRTAEELDDIVLSVDWGTLFSGRPDRRTVPVARRQDRHGTFAGVDLDWTGVRLPAGALAEHRVNRFLIQQLAPAGYAAGGDFDRLPIPFRCVATGLDDGERVVLSKGDLPRAVRASMSIPIAFPPVEWRGRRLVDGLVVDNLPVDVARGFGAAVVVAVDVGSPPLEPEEYRDALGVATQVGNLLTERRNADFAAEPDVLVRPDLGKHSTSDYSDFETLIERGHAAMKDAIPVIREKLEAAGLGEDPRPLLSGDAPRSLDGTPIVEVEVRGEERLTDRLVRRTFNVPVGPGFVLEKGLRAFDKVQASGLVEHAWMEFEDAPGGLRVVLRIEESAPNRAEVGAAFTEWEKARGVIRLRNRNTLGFGEATELLLVASEAETLGRLSLRGDRLLLLGLGYQLAVFTGTDKPRFFDEEGGTINRASFERDGVDAALRVALERWGLVEGGLHVGRVRTERRPGLDLGEGTDQVRTVRAALVLDNLDSLLWPRTGGRLATEVRWNLEGLGASRPFWRMRVEGRLGQRLGERLALQLDGLLGLSGDDLPLYDLFRLGGPYLVPGYHFEELQGPQALAASLSLHCRILGAFSVFVRAGAGDVFPSRRDIGLDGLRWGVAGGMLYPSRVGPLALEVGVGDGGKALVSVSLGWN